MSKYLHHRQSGATRTIRGRQIMAITERTLTDAEYVALRYALIKLVEGISATPYFDAD